MRPAATFAALLLGAMTFACLPGCGDDGAATVGPAADDGADAPASTAPVAAGAGTIKGVVSFAGAAPEPQEIPGARCHATAEPMSVEPVIVSPEGRLKDVMVYLKDGPRTGGGRTAPAAVLDQVNCQYVPRVLGLRTGQTLRVNSSDATLHNVHGLSTLNPAFNFGTTRVGHGRDLTFARAEQFSVKCDVHPWMLASVHVFDHPYFAATDAAGAFEIGGVPPGEYTLVFAHHFLQSAERRVTVADGRVAEADFTYQKAK